MVIKFLLLLFFFLGGGGDKYVITEVLKTKRIQN